MITWLGDAWHEPWPDEDQPRKYPAGKLSWGNEFQSWQGIVLSIEFDAAPKFFLLSVAFASTKFSIRKHNFLRELRGRSPPTRLYQQTNTTLQKFLFTQILLISRKYLEQYKLPKELPHSDCNKVFHVKDHALAEGKSGILWSLLSV